MTIHREGTATIIITVVFCGALIALVNWLLPWNGEMLNTIVQSLTYALCAFLLIIILQFFRHPKRNTPVNPAHIICPADGKVVVIEETEEPEYFKGKRRQISIFMSPLNVHVNRYPLSGKVKYVKYHKGLYLVAWHPKSSTDNERTTVVVEDAQGHEVLFRQIAGAMARRIVCYAKENDTATQGAEFGFIKFGSRVDVFLPLDAKIEVKLEQVVRGGETVLASWN